MTVAIKDKREQRANVWEQMKTLLDSADSEGSDLSAEERKSYDALEKQLDQLQEDITREERHEQRKKELETPERDPKVVPITRDDADQGESEKRYAEAFDGFLRGGVQELPVEQRQILRAGFVAPQELRAQGVATTTAGGYLVPQGFRDKIQETLKWFGGVREVAEIIQTDTGADLPWPTNDDTANVGAILAENTQATEQDVVLGQEVLKAYMYTSKIVRVSFQLLQDSAFDLEGWLSRKLGMRIGRIQNQHFTTGTGTAQPEGIQTNATIGKTGGTGQTTSVTYDDLVDLVYSVDPAYRNARAKWMLHDLSIGAARKLKDTTNRPIWEPNTQVGQPDSLLGYPIQPNNDMPVMAANAKSILFGDFFAGYVIRDVTGFQLLRLEERYADFLQVGFIGFQRSDGLQQDSAAYKAYRNSAT